MSAVAERLRHEQRGRLGRMTAEQRLREALELGERDLTVHAAAHHLARDEARRALERVAQKGRRRSRVMASLVE